MPQTTTETAPRKPRMSEAEFNRLNDIVEAGKLLKKLKTELKEHDAARSRYRLMLVQRIEAAELQYAELTAKGVQS